MLGVVCCFALFVCLTLLASFLLPSHLSLKHVDMHLETFADIQDYFYTRLTKKCAPRNSNVCTHNTRIATIVMSAIRSQLQPEQKLLG